MKNLLKRLIVTNAFAAALLLAGNAQAMQAKEDETPRETPAEIKELEVALAEKKMPSLWTSITLTELNEYLADDKNPIILFQDVDSQTPILFEWLIIKIKNRLLHQEALFATLEKTLAHMIQDKLEAVKQTSNKELAEHIKTHYKKYLGKQAKDAKEAKAPTMRANTSGTDTEDRATKWWLDRFKEIELQEAQEEAKAEDSLEEEPKLETYVDLVKHLRKQTDQTPEDFEGLLSEIRTLLQMDAVDITSGLLTRAEQNASVEDELALIMPNILHALEYFAGNNTLADYIRAHYEQYLQDEEEQDNEVN